MKFDLPTARVRIGLLATDATQDDALKSALDFALAVVENYCDRRFTWGVEEEDFNFVSSESLSVTRYPISRVRRVQGAGDAFNSSAGYKIDYDAGLIYMNGRHHGGTIKVIYEGGYKTLPADLAMALWLVFDQMYEMMKGGAAVNVGDISSISVPDVGTVRFNTGGGAASPQSSGGSTVSHIPDIAVSMLQPYRRRVA